MTVSPHLTIFAPSNDALSNAFDDIEKRYLEGGYGSEGFARIFAGGVVLGIGKDEVGWQDTWGKKGYEGDPVPAVYGIPADDMPSRVSIWPGSSCESNVEWWFGRQ